MEEQTLLTDNGGFVAKVMIPHFNELPKYICWGQRVFLLNQANEYREAFGVYATITVQEDNVGI